MSVLKKTEHVSFEDYKQFLHYDLYQQVDAALQTFLSRKCILINFAAPICRAVQLHLVW